MAVGEFTGWQVMVHVREEVPVVVDKAVTDGNDAATGDSGGAKDGSGNVGDAMDGGIFSGGLSFYS